MISAILTPAARSLLVSVFSSRGHVDASSVSTNNGARLVWENLVEANCVRERAVTPFHRFSYELTPFGRAVLLEILHTGNRQPIGKVPARGPVDEAPPALRPLAVIRTCPDCGARSSCQLVRAGDRWVECPSCGHSWATQFRKSEIA